MKAVSAILLLLLISFSCRRAGSRGESALSEVNSLEEVRNMQSALLVVFKSRVLELQDRERAIIQDVLKADPEPKGRNRWVYNIIAGKLDKYIRKHKSLIPAQVLSEADYVIYFNVVEFRRILYTYYPFGELFVIVKGSPEKLRPPRVVWRTKKMLFAEDAIGELIKDLKILRGET